MFSDARRPVCLQPALPTGQRFDPPHADSKGVPIHGFVEDRQLILWNAGLTIKKDKSFLFFFEVLRQDAQNARSLLTDTQIVRLKVDQVEESVAILDALRPRNCPRPTRCFLPSALGAAQQCRRESNDTLALVAAALREL